MPTLGEDFKDVIAKLQQNRLTPADTDNFAARLDRVEQTFTPLQKWVTPGGLNVPSITAGTGYFKLQPMGLLTLRITEPGQSMTIPNNTKTYLSFGSVVRKDGAMFTWDSADPTKIQIRDSASRGIVISGTIKWASDATGTREIVVDTFNSANTQIDGAAISRVAPANGDDTIMSFFRHWQLSNANENYIKIGVKQTSGGDLVLETARDIGFWVLH